jgi:polar amino acid transport system substrate-binding protein
LSKRTGKIRTLLTCFSMILALPPLAQATEKVVIYGDDDYAPYSYVEDGRFQGMYVDILRQAAKKLAPAYAVELQSTPWNRGLAGLEYGSVFALFPPGLKAERPYVQPYSVALYRETVVLFCNDDVMAHPHKDFPEDFRGLRIGVNLGFLLSERLIQAAKAGVVKLDAVKGNETNLRKLALKRVDCYASDRAAAMYSMKRLRSDPEMRGFTLREAVELSGEDTFIAYSAKNQPAYKADFVEKMNAALESMKTNGELEKIESNYLR